MPRDFRHLLFIGISNSVVALDALEGTEVWRAKVGGTGFVTVLWDGVELFTSAKGEVFKLDPQSGALIWNNKLAGLGRGVTTLASTRTSFPSSGQVQSAKQKRQNDQAAAAGAA